MFGRRNLGRKTHLQEQAQQLTRIKTRSSKTIGLMTGVWHCIIFFIIGVSVCCCLPGGNNLSPLFEHPTVASKSFSAFFSSFGPLRPARDPITKTLKCSLLSDAGSRLPSLRLTDASLGGDTMAHVELSRAKLIKLFRGQTKRFRGQMKLQVAAEVASV